MNKIRRARLQKCLDQLEALRSELEDIQAEEEEYRDNIPENLQGTDRYEKADDACNYLSDAVDVMDEITESIESAME